MRFIAAILVSAFACSPAFAQVATQGGMQNREIKALPAAELAGLLAGRGLGMAQAAELNHYPGPAHVLELRTELGLTEGIALVRALKPALNRYRLRLLLDIYEQVSDDEVHAAVIETLAGRPEPEAWLPALETHWKGEGDARVAAEAALAPRNDPDALLAELIRELPNDNTLAWALELAKSSDAPRAKQAAAARKK